MSDPNKAMCKAIASRIKLMADGRIYASNRYSDEVAKYPNVWEKLQRPKDIIWYIWLFSKKAADDKAKHKHFYMAIERLTKMIIVHNLEPKNKQALDLICRFCKNEELLKKAQVKRFLI